MPAVVPRGRADYSTVVTRQRRALHFRLSPSHHIDERMRSSEKKPLSASTFEISLEQSNENDGENYSAELRSRPAGDSSRSPPLLASLAYSTRPPAMPIRDRLCNMETRAHAHLIFAEGEPLEEPYRYASYYFTLLIRRTTGQVEKGWFPVVGRDMSTCQNTLRELHT